LRRRGGWSATGRRGRRRVWRAVVGGVHGLNEGVVHLEGFTNVLPERLDGAGACGGKLDRAQPQDTFEEAQDEEGILESAQCALEDVDGEDAADADDAMIGEDVTSAGPLEHGKADACEHDDAGGLDDVDVQSLHVQ